MIYKWQHVHPDGDGFFEVNGEIVDVERVSTDPSRGIYVLVAVEEGRGIVHEFTNDTEGVADDETVYCAGEKANGEPCSREVDEPGDRCFQHPE